MKKNNHKNNKLVIYLLCFIIFISVGIYLILLSLNIETEKIIKYKEQSNLDYKVNLKENEFYEDKYLGKDMLYIANLIDNIDINFDYNFSIDENSNIDFNYDIIGKLVISDEKEENSYFEKSYVLMDKKKLTMTNNNYTNIKENISIDYDYYNDLANSFKMAYGIDPSSNLTVYLRINKENAKEENIIENSVSLMSLTIPLSKKSVNIKMDYKNLDENSNVISQAGINLGNIFYLVLGIICIIIALVMMIKSMRIINLSGNVKSAYEKYVSKILKEYDRLIVETSTEPLYEDKEIITIEKFSELLDVRDNFKLPIMYYVVEKNKECCFYISYEDRIYVNSVTEEKLERERRK